MKAWLLHILFVFLEVFNMVQLKINKNQLRLTISGLLMTILKSMLADKNFQTWFAAVLPANQKPR